jgi:XTP/dITP diphosphohydrolase
VSDAGRPVVVVATGNRGKLREIEAILGDAPFALRVLEASDGVRMSEEGDDYTANAMAKARTVAQALGCVAIGDDSGIEVEALGGRPGPRSARYGGDGLDDAGRVARLLEELASSGGEAGRRARFVCIAAVAGPNGGTAHARGVCEGTILAAPRGDGGFGYDPVFAPDGFGGMSMAEVSAAEKDRISHRGRAFVALRPAIERALRVAGQPSCSQPSASSSGVGRSGS